MYSSVTSCALVGVEPRAVHIETAVNPQGRDGFVIVGLPDAAIRESRQRVKSAIRQSGYRFPGGSVIVNLSPADLPKVGATYDLPIALSVLAAGDSEVSFDEFVAVGELSLQGEVRPVRASLGATVIATNEDRACLLSSGSVVAASAGARICGVADLRAAVEVAQGRRIADTVPEPDVGLPESLELGDVRDQQLARRALEVAAAGAHHLLFVGPPGAGKTMLARCLPSILPPLSPADQRDVALVWAAAGMDRPTSATPPFRAPHHSASLAALIGGGSGLPTPGEVSKAHNGVLFLDELGEFPMAVLDSLRQPIEDGSVTVARQAGSVRFPSIVQLIAASNPCPCGYLGDRKRACKCPDATKNRYNARLSGPLLDRFDMRVDLERLRPMAMLGPRGEPSSVVRERVEGARDRQSRRGKLNSQLSGSELDDLIRSDEVLDVLTSAAESSMLSARGWDRVRRVALTLSDMDGTVEIEERHIKEAVLLRGEKR